MKQGYSWNTTKQEGKQPGKKPQKYTQKVTGSVAEEMILDPIW